MLKKYKAKSMVSVSLTLPTGGRTHISFNPVSGGGSVYYTENALIQSGLECHPKYGRLFTLDYVEQPKFSVGKSNERVTSNHESASREAHVSEIKVSCNDDAKDYLVDKFGISRTKLRSRSQIEAEGTAKGVKFIWV